MQRNLFTRRESAATVKVRLHYPDDWSGQWHEWETGDIWATVAGLAAMGIRVETMPR